MISYFVSDNTILRTMRTYPLFRAMQDLASLTYMHATHTLYKPTTRNNISAVTDRQTFEQPFFVI